MNRLEVFPSLSSNREINIAALYSRDNRDPSNSSSIWSSNRTIDKIGFFLFVASAVALLMVVFFFFLAKTPYSTATVNTSLISINSKLSSISHNIIKTAAISPEIRAFSYMLPASFTSRSIDAQRDKERITEINRQIAEIKFISDVIRRSNKKIAHTTLAQKIVRESRTLGYDPLFVTAVILAESRFDTRAISYAGAMGLMQLLPSTAQYITNKANASQWKGQQRLLSDEAYNITLGITYLKYLDEKFKGNKNHTLVAYNWGPGNMNKALRGESQIPSVSRKYRDSILTNYARWSKEFKKSASDLVLNESPANIG